MSHPHDHRQHQTETHHEPYEETEIEDESTAYGPSGANSPVRVGLSGTAPSTPPRTFVPPPPVPPPPLVPPPPIPPPPPTPPPPLNPPSHIPERRSAPLTPGHSGTFSRLGFGSLGLGGGHSSSSSSTTSSSSSQPGHGASMSQSFKRWIDKSAAKLGLSHETPTSTTSSSTSSSSSLLSMPSLPQRPATLSGASIRAAMGLAPRNSVSSSATGAAAATASTSASTSAPSHLVRNSSDEAARDLRDFYGIQRSESSGEAALSPTNTEDGTFASALEKGQQQQQQQQARAPLQRPASFGSLPSTSAATPPQGTPLREVLQDPSRFSRLIELGGRDGQQNILFLCELEQFITHHSTMSVESARNQMGKIYNMYLMDRGLLTVLALTQDARERLERATGEVRFPIDLAAFLRARDQIAAAVERGPMRKYWQYEATIASKVQSLGAKSEGGATKALPSVEFRFNDVRHDEDVFRSFLLFLMRERRHRLLLFFRDLETAGVPNIRLPAEARRAARRRELLKRQRAASASSSATPFSRTPIAPPVDHPIHRRRKSSGNVSDAAAEEDANEEEEEEEDDEDDEEDDDVDVEEPEETQVGFSDLLGLEHVAATGPQPEINVRLLRTLRLVYRKYVSSGVPPPEDDGTEDEMADREAAGALGQPLSAAQLRVRRCVFALVRKLKPMHSKVDRILSMQCWSQFFRSAEYQELVVERIAELQAASEADSHETTAPDGTRLRASSSGTLHGSQQEDREQQKAQQLLQQEKLIRHRRRRARKNNLISYLNRHRVTRDLVVINCQVLRKATTTTTTTSDSVTPATAPPVASPSPSPSPSPAPFQLAATPKPARLLDYVVLFRGVMSASGSKRASAGAAASPSSGRSGNRNMYAVRKEFVVPRTSRTDLPLPPHLDQFCFPMNCEAARKYVLGWKHLPTSSFSSPARRVVTNSHLSAALSASPAPSPSAAAAALAAMSMNGGGVNGLGGTGIGARGSPSPSPNSEALQRLQQQQHLQQQRPRDMMFTFVLTTPSGGVMRGACLQMYGADDVSDESGVTTRRSVCYALSLLAEEAVMELLLSSLRAVYTEYVRLRTAAEADFETREAEAALIAAAAGTVSPPPPPWAMPLAPVMRVLLGSSVVRQLARWTTVMPAVPVPRALGGMLPAALRETVLSPELRDADLVRRMAAHFFGGQFGGANMSLMSANGAPRTPVLLDPAPGPGLEAFSLVLRCLHPKRVLLALEALLMEKKVLIVSSQISLLTIAGEVFRCLLYPFEWTYLYVPFLPVSLFQYLQCPTPFLIGVHSAFLEQLHAMEGFMSDPELVVIDLDADSVAYQERQMPAHLPSRWQRGLVDSMRTIFGSDVSNVDYLDGLQPVVHPSVTLAIPSPLCAPCAGLEVVEGAAESLRATSSAVRVTPGELSPDHKLRLVFLRMWVHLLSGFRNFVIHIPDTRDPALLFDTPAFVNSKSSQLETFLRSFVRTQAFSVFLLRRSWQHGMLTVPVMNIGGSADVIADALAEEAEMNERAARAASAVVPTPTSDPAASGAGESTAEGFGALFGDDESADAPEIDTVFDLLEQSGEAAESQSDAVLAALTMHWSRGAELSFGNVAALADTVEAWPAWSGDTTPESARASGSVHTPQAVRSGSGVAVPRESPTRASSHVSVFVSDATGHAVKVSGSESHAADSASHGASTAAAAPLAVEGPHAPVVSDGDALVRPASTSLADEEPSVSLGEAEEILLPVSSSAAAAAAYARASAQSHHHAHDVDADSYGLDRPASADVESHHGNLGGARGSSTALSDDAMQLIGSLGGVHRAPESSTSDISLPLHVTNHHDSLRESPTPSDDQLHSPAARESSTIALLNELDAVDGDNDASPSLRSPSSRGSA